jgi:hypothetical protein
MVIIVIILKKCAQNRDNTGVAVGAKHTQTNFLGTHVKMRSTGGGSVKENLEY